MKESEAIKKWCPYVRVTITPNDATWQGNMMTNRGEIPASNTDTLCIGSNCMMWQPRGEGEGDCGLKQPDFWAGGLPVFNPPDVVEPHETVDDIYRYLGEVDK